MKKILSIVVAMMLVAALAVSAFAAEPPIGEVLFTANGPKTETNWWFDAWLDDTQKRELSSAIAGGATHIVVAVEGDMDLTVEGAGFQVGFQDNVNWDAGWALAMWHSNFAAGEGQIGGYDAIEFVDGISYIYLNIQEAIDWFAANSDGFDLTAGTGYQFITGTATGWPLVAVYAVNAPEVTAAPAEEAPADEPAEEPATETEAPADEPAVEPAEEETPAEEAPAETGVALAVIPAIVAMAAVVISKKR